MRNLRQTTKMASDNKQKLDELSRKLGVQEDELTRAMERAELAETKLKGIEEELQTVSFPCLKIISYLHCQFPTTSRLVRT